MTERQAINCCSEQQIIYYLNCQMWIYSIRKGYIVSITTMVDTMPTFTVEDVETDKQTELLAVDLLETEAEAEAAREIAQAKCDNELPPDKRNEIILGYSDFLGWKKETQNAD